MRSKPASPAWTNAQASDEDTFGARRFVGLEGHARHFTTTNKSTKESKLSMKILDIPQSGRRGLNVSLKSAFGLVSRTVAIPANPRTPSQMEVRNPLTRVSARWRALEEVQRTAWVVAAKEAKSNSRLGQSGALSGFLLFTKINCTLSQFGEAQVDAPPEHPQFPDLGQRAVD